MTKPHPEDELRLGQTPEGYRSGFVGLLGRPNVGKSTLVNQVMRSKVAITSARPQTTRHAVRGILTTRRAQLVFVDTPGIHKPVTALGQRLNSTARSAAGEVDVLVLVVDAAAGIGRGDDYTAGVVREARAPVIVALNKIDLLTDAEVDAQAVRASSLGGWPVCPVSAKSGAGVQELVDGIAVLLPEGPLYYPPDEVTDQPVRLRIAELVREKVLELTREEVPHAVAVVVEEMEREDGVLNVDVTIYVERDSQKGIVIGKRGAMLKQVGTRARSDVEALLGEHVYLRLRVKVERDWQRRAAAVERFGYGE